MRPSLERVSIWKGDDMCKPLRKYQMRPRITSMEQGDKKSGTLQPTKCCQTGLHVHIPMNECTGLLVCRYHNHLSYF